MSAMKTVVMMCLVGVLSGCAANSKVVRCDGRLEPINLPVPRVTLAGEADSSSPNEPEGDSE